VTTLFSHDDPPDDVCGTLTRVALTWPQLRPDAVPSSRPAGGLDEAEDEFETSERLRGSLQIVAPTLRLSQAEQEEMLPYVRLTRYRTDEYIQFAGQVPKRMTFVVSGRVRPLVAGDDGAIVPVRSLEDCDFSARPR
jgi:hypothetical protein